MVVNMTQTTGPLENVIEGSLSLKQKKKNNNRGKSEHSPPLPQIMQQSFPHLGKWQGSAYPEYNRWSVHWKNHLHVGISPARQVLNQEFL